MSSALKSWLPIPPGSPFSLSNLPFGIISYPADKNSFPDTAPRPAVAIGDLVLDLARFHAGHGFQHFAFTAEGVDDETLGRVFEAQPDLNAFAALGRPVHAAVRRYLQQVFQQDGPFADVLERDDALRQTALAQQRRVRCHLPMNIKDYTDFYAGEHHARRCGVIFRGPANALQPNYTHLPVGYHGRASSVVVSGTDIRRPRGQILEDPAAAEKKPVFSASRRMDIEVELAAFLCKPNEMGSPISVADAPAHIFGFVLMNDWSARDIQAWEYVPLGPFNGKNFGTSVSPWVVLADALEPFRVPGIDNQSPLLPYLRENGLSKPSYDIAFEVDIAPEGGKAQTLLKTNGRHLMWSFSQMLAHHTIGGCPCNVGDLIASGTISGEDERSLGSLIELTSNGKQSFQLDDGVPRTFLRDGDTVTIRGVCGSDPEALVGFGECTGTILPALPL